MRLKTARTSCPERRVSVVTFDVDGAAYNQHTTDQLGNFMGRYEPGRYTYRVVADGRHATFLPKVWEMLPDPQKFLAALKAKCGLADDYWSERLEFRRYRTTSYSE